MMQLRFREWGSTDWTIVRIEGEDAVIAMSILGSGLSRRYHVQLWVEGKWENLGE